MNVSVIVPVKNLGDGKSRLAGVMNPVQRQALCSLMFERTLELVTNFDDVIVVSHDERVGERVARGPASCRFVKPQGPMDLNHDIDEARGHLAPDRAFLVLPTDLIFMDAGALKSFVADIERCGIAPDNAGQGTNLLLVPAVAAAKFQFAFGTGSFTRHQDEARRWGLTTTILRSARSAFDLDTPSDLEVIGHDFIEKMGITFRSERSSRHNSYASWSSYAA